MRLVIVQVLFFFAGAEIAKRAPLQIGLVAFTERPHVHNETLPKTGVAMGAHSHKWIPGRVRHNSYIPAHLHHLYIPAHAVLLRTVQTVFVESGVYSPYRQHLGGFGIGLDVGGQGAGHGYHVVLDF